MMKRLGFGLGFSAAIFVCTPIAAHAQATTNSTARDLAASCAICHGTNGVNAGGLPHLAGQPQSYIVQQLKDFRDGKRPATIMHQVAKGYTDQQYELLGAYFAAQKHK
ncbi:MAG TPA: c-type cytochrome [Burkholderiales bacterium]